MNWLLAIAALLAQDKTQDGRRLLDIELTSRFTAQRLPWEDPGHAAWAALPATKLKLVPQQVQEPMLMSPTLGELTVRAMHNRTWIAFHLEWEDATNSNTLRSDRFGDGAAVEFPLSLKPLPEYRMGDEGRPVHLAFWRAERQRAFEEKVDFLAENYPYLWCDTYAFAPTSYGFLYTPALATEEQRYLAAQAAGNPSRIGVAPPVEELSAQTWNRVTVQKSQDARGRGVWKDGRWRLVIARPIASADAEDAPLDGRDSWAVAFAAWDGGRQNVGPRKMVVEGWIRLKLETK